MCDICSTLNYCGHLARAPSLHLPSLLQRNDHWFAGFPPHPENTLIFGINKDRQTKALMLSRLCADDTGAWWQCDCLIFQEEKLCQTLIIVYHTVTLLYNCIRIYQATRLSEYPDYLWGAIIIIGCLSTLAARLLHGSASVITMVTLTPPPLIYQSLRWQMNLWSGRKRKINETNLVR